MPKPRKAGRFGGSPGHHNLMMANLATELIRHGRIRTTHAKAKTVQPIAERMITLAKRGDLHSRRQVLRVIRDTDVVHHLFSAVGPAFVERNGGYTRVLKLGARKGDAAPMALIELVDRVTVADGADEEQSRRRWSLRRRRSERADAAASEPTPTAEPDPQVDGEVEGDGDAVDDDGAADEQLPPTAGGGAVEAQVADSDPTVDGVVEDDAAEDAPVEDDDSTAS